MRIVRANSQGACENNFLPDPLAFSKSRA